MDNVPNSVHIISNLSKTVDLLFSELREIASQSTILKDSDTLNNYEENLHNKARSLADHITGLKIQQALTNNELKDEPKFRS